MQGVLVVLFALITYTSWGMEKPTAPESLSGVQIVTAEQAVALILSTPELVILDTRKKEEYEKGHIEKAISLTDTDMFKLNFQSTYPDKEQPMLLYCNGVHCLRSSNAAKKCLQWGYSNLYWMRGGWQEWMNKALPVTY